MKTRRTVKEILYSYEQSDYSKAQELYDLWFYEKNKEAKYAFDRLREQYGFRDDYYAARRSAQKLFDEGVRVSFSESYSSFMALMYDDYGDGDTCFGKERRASSLIVQGKQIHTIEKGFLEPTRPKVEEILNSKQTDYDKALSLKDLWDRKKSLYALLECDRIMNTKLGFQSSPAPSSNEESHRFQLGDLPNSVIDKHYAMSSDESTRNQYIALLKERYLNELSLRAVLYEFNALQEKYINGLYKIYGDAGFIDCQDSGMLLDADHLDLRFYLIALEFNRYMWADVIRNAEASCLKGVSSYLRIAFDNTDLLDEYESTFGKADALRMREANYHSLREAKDISELYEFIPQREMIFSSWHHALFSVAAVVTRRPITLYELMKENILSPYKDLIEKVNHYSKKCTTNTNYMSLFTGLLIEQRLDEKKCPICGTSMKGLFKKECKACGYKRK